MSWFLIDYIGRRNLTVYGTIGLTVILWVMGGLAVGGLEGELRGAIALILVYCWFYNVTIGATAYTILTEVPAPRLRVKTIAIGLATANSFGVMWSFVLPYLFNPNEANLGGKVGFIFGGMCFPCVWFLWWYLPETRLRSYNELDEMFTKKVPAKDFKHYHTDAEAKGEKVMREMKE